MNIKIKNLGQIIDGDVTFSDFTVLVGSQASGKSITLQLLKLALDAPTIKNTLRRYAFDWKHNELLNLYFGEGMSSIWKPQTHIQTDNGRLGIQTINSSKHRKKEQLFYIPAQRVISIQDGWPRPFNSYSIGDPFVVKEFSESLRTLMEKGLGTGKSAIFPQPGRMKSSIRTTIDNNIFHGNKVELDKTGLKKRIVLNVGKAKLPYMTWSAGQREFMPLLLGLYWLMPSSKTSTKDGIKYVVIEEPEMGLHPYAIKSLLLVFLELNYRGYRVIISTHSPIILEMVWAIQSLRDTKADLKNIYELFQLKRNQSMDGVMKNALSKTEFKVYAFDRKSEGVTVKDISSLDPYSDDEFLAEWGGLTEFSSDASSVISKAVTKHELQKKS